MAYPLPAIPYLKLRFILISRQDNYLPSIKGSLLRGAFGHALRRTVCVMGPQQPCPSCMLRKQCVYPRLFETLIDPQDQVPRFLRGLPTAPRPYIFEPVDEARFYKADEALTFDLILLGQATELHPYTIFAVSQMAEQGLGVKRMPFRLEKVHWQSASLLATAPDLRMQNEAPPPEAEWRLLYDGATKVLLDTPTPLLPARQSHEPSNPLKVSFLTPARLKFNDSLSADFTFRMLVFKMLRRVLELAHFHAPGAHIDWEFHDLLVAADRVKITARALRWIDWERHSNRQKTEMKMGGFVGEMVIAGNLSPFIELLRVCEIVHVGKGAVFGNGKILISPLLPAKAAG